MKTQLDRARQLLGEGETSESIEAIEEALTASELGAAQIRALENEIILVSSALSAYQRKVGIGTIAGTEANVEAARINDGILRIINDLETRKTPETYQEKRQKQRAQWVWIGLAAVMLGMVGIWYSSSRQFACPDYQADKKWKIGVLPLLNLGDRPAQPEQVLATTINELTAQNNLSAQTVVWEAYPGAPRSDRQNALQKCGVDLLISGQYVVLTNDSIEVSLQYQFTDNRPPVQTAFVGFKNVTALREGVMQNRSLYDAIISLCTILAMRENNVPLAQKWIEKINKPEGWEAEMQQEMMREK